MKKPKTNPSPKPATKPATAPVAAPKPKPAQKPKRQKREGTLFNKAMLKRLFLERAKVKRPEWGPTRFSDENYVIIAAHFRNYVDRQLMAQPSVGKTIKLAL